MTHTMVIGDVAELFRVSTTRIRQLDELLQPIRKPNGARRYSRDIVEQVLRDRQQNSEMR
jgi:DNA-binding transcriptional MerR regulator